MNDSDGCKKFKHMYWNDKQENINDVGSVVAFPSSTSSKFLISDCLINFKITSPGGLRDKILHKLTEL